VALSGLGGDELFGGYPSFARVRRARLLTMLPEPIRRTLAGIVSRATSSVPRAAKAGNLLDAISPLDVYRLSRQLFGQSDIQAFGLACGADVSSRLPAVPADADPFLAISLYELGHYMANTLLRDTDCMSMAHALEVRVPFVDRDVVRTVLAIPSLYKMNGRPKGLLLDALGDMLPTEVWQRPKQGFGLPFDCWMRSALRAEIDGVLSDRDRIAHIGLEPGCVRQLWNVFLRHPRWVGWSRLWALYVLAKWCELQRTTL
ncbi:MAG TPA: asparagine synthase-related protein, partial [Candidatus Acidoferrales bacterium]|nr:asparagine synthase-related protein [Candidatus Acidoferrales bacterium]